jgi:hypothetical protein
LGKDRTLPCCEDPAIGCVHRVTRETFGMQSACDPTTGILGDKTSERRTPWAW